MVDRTHLLNSRQMAQFVADGYLRFDELVSQDLNEGVKAKMDNQAIPGGKAGTPFREMWPDTPIGKMFRLPEIEGIINRDTLGLLGVG